MPGAVGFIGLGNMGRPMALNPVIEVLEQLAGVQVGSEVDHGSHR